MRAGAIHRAGFVAALIAAGCSPRPLPAHDASKPAIVAATPVDAALPDPSDAPPSPEARPAATEIHPVDIAGPFSSLADSCKAAPPCGFTDMDEAGRETKPAMKPRCDAVIDPTNDIVGHLPMSMTKTGGATAMTHKTGDVEIRLGGVICEVPKFLRRQHSMYYVFIHRSDGWWRTTAAMFDYDFNDKFCGGALYVMWNDKPTRTIAGIAAESACLACSKQAERSKIAELMLRIDATGAKPAVFPLLPVGARDRLELEGGEAPDCKPNKSAMSLQETWPSDDEVVLDGKSGPSVKTSEGLTLEQIVGDGAVTPGRYRFMR
jgi:hypothetical protein